jgi:hypothetical protein
VIFWSAINLHGPKWSVIEPLFKPRSQSDLRRHWLCGTPQHRKPLEGAQAVREGPLLELPDDLPDFASAVLDDPTELWLRFPGEVAHDLD